MLKATMATRSFLPILAATLACCASAQDDTTVTIDWANTVAISKTFTALQVVVNPLIGRDSPVHDQIFESLNGLGADHVRYVPWLPTPLLSVAELYPPSADKLCGFRSTNTGFPLTIDCGSGNTISVIDFAVYGESSGYCGSLVAGSCTAPSAMSIVSTACLNKQSCTLISNDTFFGGNPCGGGVVPTLAVQVQCSDQQKRHVYWDTSLIDPMTEDFMNATENDPSGASNHSVIINFSTAPQWLYDTGANNRVPVPDDWHLNMWDYERGSSLVDPTANDFGAYYGRLLAWYTEGGFTDVYGNFHASPYHYNISIWECLNELEHGTDVQMYTVLYDSMVTHMQQAAPHGSKGMKWMAGALGGDSQGFWEYFLNMTNHASPDIPIDYISFHFYASCNDRADPNGYSNFFVEADNTFADVNATIQVRNALQPNVMIDMDELGVILPDDNDPKWTSDAPGFDNIYWNSAAGLYAYEFARYGLLGVDVLGMSQLVGFPELPNYPSGPGALQPQYPSVAILNWTTGLGTARYWVLKMLIEEFHIGDAMVNTTTSNTAPNASNPFCGTIINLATLDLACADPTATIDAIQFASYGTPTGSCGNYSIGSCNAANSTTIVESYCLGKNSCSVPATTPIFGDPCYDTVKNLVVQAHCSTGGGYQPGLTSAVHAQAYVGADNTRKVLIISKENVQHTVNVPGSTGGSMLTVDLATGFGPARQETVGSGDSIPLAPYAVVVVTMP